MKKKELKKRLKELEKRVAGLESAQSMSEMIGDLIKQPAKLPEWVKPFDQKQFENNQYSEYGMRFDGGPIGYVCPNPRCPTGLRGTQYSTTTGATRHLPNTAMEILAKDIENC